MVSAQIDRQNLTPGVQQNTTGFFYTGDGAVVNKLNDRLFIGGATLNDGKYPNGKQDWMSSLTAHGSAVKVDWLVQSSVVAILTQQPGIPDAVDGAILGLTVGARASDGDNGCVALAAFAQNDGTGSAWALYAEAWRESGAGYTIGTELEIVEFGSDFNPDPYNIFNGSTCLTLTSGGDHSTASTASVALSIVPNVAKFHKGILFYKTALLGCDGATGTATAIAFAKGHEMTWYNASSQVCAQIRSDIATAANLNSIFFTDIGMQLGTPNLAVFIPQVTNGVNWLILSNATTGNNVSVGAGGETNVGLTLAPNGSGLVKFGNAASFAANASVATVLGSVGPSGSHTTVQKWLAIKDSGGTTGYIPVF